ncbi:MAG: hypothetical protein HY055_04480 [Magnetospirillum sp.]|nr:hypothetical protein [Magnetospirillum sp.]
MRQAAIVSCFILALAGSPSALRAADTVPAHLDAARAAHAKGDLARAAIELEAAIAELHARLGKSLAEFMPAPLNGWQAEAVETQSLASSGGGLAVSRAYAHDDSSLNAALIIDSPAVAAAISQFAAPPQPNMRKVKLNGEDALVRWDSSSRTGEVVIVLGARVLLQIEGDNLANSELLSDAAKGWNLGGIRKSLGG